MLMSQENVEIVRRFYEVLNEWLTSFWSDPEQPLNESRGVEKVFEHLDAEAEWDWVFSPETFRGREQLLQAVADWLETVTDWRVEVEELIDGSRDRVLMIGRVVGTRQGQRHSGPSAHVRGGHSAQRQGRPARGPDG
jgi:SnoaL-like domain